MATLLLTSLSYGGFRHFDWARVSGDSYVTPSDERINYIFHSADFIITADAYSNGGGSSGVAHAYACVYDYIVLEHAEVFAISGWKTNYNTYYGYVEYAYVCIDIFANPGYTSEADATVQW